jgi:hypothetical protein
MGEQVAVPQESIEGQSELRVPNMQLADVGGIDDVNDFFEKVYSLNSEQYQTTSIAVGRHKQRELVVPATEKKPLYVFRSDYTGNEVIEIDDGAELGTVRHKLLTPAKYLGGFEDVLTYYRAYSKNVEAHESASFLDEIYHHQIFLASQPEYDLSPEDIENYSKMYLQESARHALSQTVELLLP